MYDYRTVLGGSGGQRPNGAGQGRQRDCVGLNMSGSDGGDGLIVLPHGSKWLIFDLVLTDGRH